MSEDPQPDDETEEPSSARERLEEGADKAIGEFDQGVVDLLAWLLDTETRARIYVYLRQHPDSTSEEVAEGTGLYPSTVREALAELHEESTVSRGKRESEGAGNNPYEYEAISPSDLVSGAVGQVQNQLNAVFNLDDRLDRDSEGDDEGPVTISVTDADAEAESGDEESEDVEPTDEGDGDATAAAGSEAEDE
jgi:predicted transcriptional regulator